MTDTTTVERDPAFVEVKDNPAREAARDMIVVAGVKLENWAQLVDFSKYMGASGFAVAKPLRGNLGACMRVIEQASRWGFSAFDLASHCYVVNDILAYDSLTIHAIIEKFAPLKYRLRPKFEGEGDDRTCTVTGHFKGELDPLDYTTPQLGQINPKNSPLWKSDPDQQLWYFATRRWAKRYCPDILLGAYAVDELLDSPGIVPDRHIGFDHAKDVSPKLAERLSVAKSDEGFVGEQSIQSIDAALNAAKAPEPVKKKDAEEHHEAGNA